MFYCRLLQFSGVVVDRNEQDAKIFAWHKFEKVFIHWFY